MSPLLIASIIVGVLGVAAWVGGYLRFTRHLPKYDSLRGLPCVPGMLLVVVGVILFAFFWHWVVGGLAIVACIYGGYRLIVSKAS